MHPEVTSTKAGRSCPQCRMKLVARTRDRRQEADASPTPPLQPASSTAERVRAFEALAPTYEFACLMHPKVRQAQEGICLKCGMPLSTVRPSVRGAYRLAVTQTPRAATSK